MVEIGIPTIAAVLLAYGSTHMALTAYIGKQLYANSRLLSAIEARVSNLEDQ
jgi:hypothetical protein